MTMLLVFVGGVFFGWVAFSPDERAKELRDWWSR